MTVAGWSREHASEFLDDDPVACAIFRGIDAAVTEAGSAERRLSKSQIGFYREHPFAAVWRPAQYLGGSHPPLVLSLFLTRKDQSPRWGEVTEARPGRFTHHLELSDPKQVDRQVYNWIAEAWNQAG